MLPSSYPDDKLIAELTAKMFLDIKAVHFNPKEPFTLASGLSSPTYIDCRKLISYPQIRSTVMDFMACKILRNAGFDAFDNIAGGETAGIPFAALIAERLGLPMTYVRKKPKGYGKDAQIEGKLDKGQRVLLVEDLTTDGGSKLKFVEAIRKAEGICNDTAVIFYYDIFPGTLAKLSQDNINLHYLCTWKDILEAARKGNYFDVETLDQVELFLNDPINWATTHQ
ncbi:orotate phosphoribosyltransferase [Paracoccaceae bacterium]|jgi:orotate phosphoribosyltransferase|nr:orotate phosphoribosyltransferase [Paracoccaceae bacterium]MDA9228609.1 orotate phosphoribosyltransferase [Paracoccaceae bacterium]MDE2693084.1 orotate phosphoribosyltransferase [Paracoccaceae bacterium]|tara:strand:- start:505 stop:1179 length:675 start_codon:yes stop_codon:yes gene_type:complete